MMRTKKQKESLPDELVIAVGLVWGHLNARQFESAYALARGCLGLWPQDRGLLLMYAYAAAEMLEPVDEARLEAVEDPACDGWKQLVRRRAAGAGQARPALQQA